MRRLVWIAVLSAGLCAAQERPEGAKQEASAEQAEDSLQIWRWANFVILAAGLGYLILKSVPAMFRTRTEEIQKGIAEAQKLKMDAEKRAAEMESRMAKIGEEIDAFKVKAKAEMEQEGRRILEETAAQARKMEAQAAAEIESAGKLARASLKQHAADLALDLAAQRIKARLDAGTEEGLVDNFLADLKQQGSKN